MNSYFPSFLLILFIFSTLGSCKKVDKLDYVKEPCIKGVICYSVMGEEFISDLPVFDTSGFVLSGTEAQLIKVSYSTVTTLSLEITGYDQTKNTTLIMNIPYPCIHDSTYRFNESQIHTHISRPERQTGGITNWCDDHNSQNTNGYITITAIDTAAQFVSGTFNVPITCYSMKVDGSTWVYYENQMLVGKFDSIYLKKIGGPW